MEAAIIVVAPPSVVAVTHERNKNNNTHGRSPNVVKSDFPYYKELFLKEKNHSYWKQILSFKRSSSWKWT